METATRATARTPACCREAVAAAARRFEIGVEVGRGDRWCLRTDELGRVESGCRGEKADDPHRRKDEAAVAAARATPTRTGEEMRVEATPPLFSMSAENRLTAARTPAPSRETSKVPEMTALASSAARAGVGNGGQGETVMKGGGWGVMLFWICYVVDVGGPRLYLGPLYRSRILRSKPGPLHGQSGVFFSKNPRLWSKCGVLRVGRCKGLSMACRDKTIHCQSGVPLL